VRQQSAPLRAIARVLGSLLLALGGLSVLAVIGLAFQGDRSAMFGAAVLAFVFGVPGWLISAWAVVAERRHQAAALVQTRERFTIDEVAKVLRSSSEVAHVFIAGQIAAHALPLTYQPETRGYAKRALSAPATPCPSCGVAVAPTETGFCPNCGARRS